MTYKALKLLKWGFAFIFIHITFSTGSRSFDLLPDFVGMFLILQAFRSQEMTETEKRVCPLLVILIADYFLHWLIPFENGLENILITVISIYAIYVLIGEIALRIEEKQPEYSNRLEWIRIAFTVIQVCAYVFGSYNIAMVPMLLSVVFIIILVMLLWILFHIEPVEEN